VELLVDAGGVSTKVMVTALLGVADVPDVPVVPDVVVPVLVVVEVPVELLEVP
jgi:hypothetical protein